MNTREYAVQVYKLVCYLLQGFIRLHPTVKGYKALRRFLADREDKVYGVSFFIERNAFKYDKEKRAVYIDPKGYMSIGHSGLSMAIENEVVTGLGFMGLEEIPSNAAIMAWLQNALENVPNEAAAGIRFGRLPKETIN